MPTHKQLADAAAGRLELLQVLATVTASTIVDLTAMLPPAHRRSSGSMQCRLMRLYGERLVDYRDDRNKHGGRQQRWWLTDKGRQYLQELSNGAT